MTKDLLLAILAMDAYNRGYGEGIEGLSDAIGTKIGTATISEGSDTDADSSEVAAGFYAVAYDTEFGKIISYRGTNATSPDVLLTDVWTGWSAGLGFSDASQAGLALKFYTAVTGQGIYDGAADNTTLIGHSLGGGLAGFVSSLTNTPGVGFDHMPFGLAALAQYVSDFPDGTLPSFDQFQGVYVEGDILQLGRNGLLQFGIAGSWLSFR